MHKWSYLIESDVIARSAERIWQHSGSDEDLIAYVTILLRANQEVPDDIQTQYDAAMANRTQHNAMYLAINRASPLLKKRKPRNAGARFARIRAAFKKDPSEETADDFFTEYERVKGSLKDREISRHCHLQGKMGQHCNQANQTEITTLHYIILVSYRTPVAYRVRSTGDEFVTDRNHSVTTNQHIWRWTGTHATTVPQAEIDDIYRTFR